MTLATRPSPQHGFSLVELMVAITIGAILLAGLATMFDRANRTNHELGKVSQLIDNGQYVMQLLFDTLHNTGYYGQFVSTLKVPAALPDPCETSNTANLNSALDLPVQGYAAATLNSAPPIPGTCSAYGLTANNLAPGSDILVVRRADTLTLAAAPIKNEVYLQANSLDAEVQLGDPTGFLLGALNADNSIKNVGTKATGGSVATILKKANVTGATPVDNSLRLAADIRKLHVEVYFVAPCSVPADNSNVCTGAADDGGMPIPTLKRLDLTSVSGNTTMQIVSLVEGVERLTIDYGIDDQPTGANSLTQLPGDGVPDTFSHGPALANWPNVVTARIYALLRTLSPTPGQVDSKTYNMGLIGVTTARNDAYKRHLFTGNIRLINLSSRREIPQ